MRHLLIFIATFFLVQMAQAEADAAAGKAAYASCVACHGANGEGSEALNSPVLAGLDAAYLSRQLNHFKTGIRGASGDILGMQMRSMVGLLADDNAVANVSAYIASMPIAFTEADAGEADLRNGENQYNAACGACHGGQAQGNPALHAPRLAGQHIAYVKRQLQNFASGIRGDHPEDRYGRQMKMMANMLNSDKDIADVMAFIANQRAKP